MTTGLSIAIHTWGRLPQMLEQSLWTLSHQTVLPDEIVVSETSPDMPTQQAIHELCIKYPLMRLIEGHWSRINVSRAANVAIRNTAESSQYVCVVAMELLFSRNFIEVLLAKLDEGRYNRAACGTLEPRTSIGSVDTVWDRWEYLCSQIVPNPPGIAPGAILCASRKWWFDVQGFDEARRPFSYPDVDIHDRALRSGLDVECGNIDWTEAQTIHPYHPPSGFFYGISGHKIDTAGIDAPIRRNDANWGDPKGDELARIAGT